MTAIREVIARVIAEDYGWRPWEELAENKVDLRNNRPIGPHAYNIEEPTKASFLCTADAVLAAMREPTDDILSAAVEPDGTPRDPYDAWQAMIDAALTAQDS